MDSSTRFIATPGNVIAAYARQADPGLDRVSRGTIRRLSLPIATYRYSSYQRGLSQFIDTCCCWAHAVGYEFTGVAAEGKGCFTYPRFDSLCLRLGTASVRSYETWIVATGSFRRKSNMMRRKDCLSLGLGLLLVIATAELTAAATTESPVLFVGDFEDGKLVHGQHWNVAGNAPEITSEEVRAGHYAMKTTLDRDNSAINFRTEIRPLAPDPIKQKDYWYGFSIFLPKDFVADPVWQIVAQFHDNEDNAAERGRNPMLSWQVKTASGRLRAFGIASRRPLRMPQGSGCTKVFASMKLAHTTWECGRTGSCT